MKSSVNALLDLQVIDKERLKHLQARLAKQKKLAAAQAAATAYASAQHRIGRDVTQSGLFAALHQPGVQRVVLAAPAATLTIGSAQASWCTAITLTNGGVDE